MVIGGTLIPMLVGGLATASLASRGLSTAKVMFLEGFFSVEFIAGDIAIQIQGG